MSSVVSVCFRMSPPLGPRRLVMFGRSPLRPQCFSPMFILLLVVLSWWLPPCRASVLWMEYVSAIHLSSLLNRLGILYISSLSQYSQTCSAFTRVVLRPSVSSFVLLLAFEITVASLIWSCVCMYVAPERCASFTGLSPQPVSRATVRYCLTVSVRVWYSYQFIVLSFEQIKISLLFLSSAVTSCYLPMERIHNVGLRVVDDIWLRFLNN